MTARALTQRQMVALGLVATGFVSQSVLNAIPALIRRGLVEDLGLYDYENHVKRYGSERYKATAAGHLVLKADKATA